MGLYVLSAVSHVVYVPRQSDRFSVDIMCNLFDRLARNALPSRNFFNVQLKSNRKKIEVRAGSRAWSVFRTPLPFFVGVVDLRKHEFALYHTIYRINQLQKYGGRDKLVIYLRERLNDGQGGFDEETRIVETGRPIAKFHVLDLDEPTTRSKTRESLRLLLERWIIVDSVNIALMQLDFPIVFKPRTYDTNQIPEDTLVPTGYARPQSFGTAVRSSEIVLAALSGYLQVLLQRGPMETDALTHLQALLDRIREFTRQGHTVLDRWSTKRQDAP